MLARIEMGNAGVYRMKKRKPQRPITKAERDAIRNFWPTMASDKELEGYFRRHRGVLHRVAREYLGLPPRIIARREMFVRAGGVDRHGW